MEAVLEVFAWTPQRDGSSVEERHIGTTKPNYCYFMPVHWDRRVELLQPRGRGSSKELELQRLREETASAAREFRQRRVDLQKEFNRRKGKKKRNFADLGKRFNHPL